MSIKTDIAIVGGGLNGPALSLGLAQAGFNVSVIDALPAPERTARGFDGRAYALALSSVRLLRNLSLWSDVADCAQAMLEIKVTDGRAGEGPAPWMMHFDYAEIEEGPMGYMVEDRHLRPALLAAMDKYEKITSLNETRVVAQTTGATGAALELSSGDVLEAKLVIGADGKRSGSAQRAGIRRTGWSYGQTALVCAVAHERPHNGIAHQFFMPNGPLAILPLRGNRSSIVWSEKNSRAAKLMDMTPESFLVALRPAFGSFLGEIRLEGDRFSYPLSLSLANRMVASRLALVGDAAHGLHPIAGQGLNAGLRDVAALIDVLTSAKARGEDIGSEQVLARYAQWRRFDTTTLALATDTFNKLFSNDNPVLRGMRGLGMGLVGKLPGVRRGFVREAAGLTGELPTLMRG